MKRCPFCNSMNVSGRAKYDGYMEPYAYVECNSCGARGPEKANLMDAQKYWNMRR